MLPRRRMTIRNWLLVDKAKLASIKTLLTNTKQFTRPVLAAKYELDQGFLSTNIKLVIVAKRRKQTRAMPVKTARTMCCPS